MPDAPTLTAEQVAAATKVVPIDTLHPHPRNANRGNVAAIRESLRKHGQFRSLVVQKSSGFILAGNTTWKAAKEEGRPDIAIIELDVEDDQALRILLADNKTAQLGNGYDDQALAELLTEIKAAEDWTGTGWTETDLDALLEEMGSDLDPGEPEEPVQPTRQVTDCPQCGHTFTPELRTEGNPGAHW